MKRSFVLALALLLICSMPALAARNNDALIPSRIVNAYNALIEYHAQSMVNSGALSSDQVDGWKEHFQMRPESSESADMPAVTYSNPTYTIMLQARNNGSDVDEDSPAEIVMVLISGKLDESIRQYAAVYLSSALAALDSAIDQTALSDWMVASIRNTESSVYSQTPNLSDYTIGHSSSGDMYGFDIRSN